MATCFKFLFQTHRPNIEVFVFLSLFIHFCLFWQLEGSGLSGSPFQKLLGQKGGPLEAQEIAYFPHLGKATPKSVASAQSEQLSVAEKKQSAQKAKEAAGTASQAARGIGQGGASTQYSAVLHAYLDSAKVFPRSLKELGLSGVVKVRFEVTPEGQLTHIRVLESEAPELITAEALRFLKTLDSVPVPPSDLTKKELEFELPLRYELNT